MPGTAALAPGSVKPSAENWQERLLPNVIYEDFKAIQKIETVVRFTGVQDISSVTIDHPRLRSEQGNRIWLCMPRNQLAARRLERLEGRTWFRFERDSEGRHHIVWKPKDQESDLCQVQSPLFAYLKKQKRPKKSKWHTSFGEIVARDYAVLARFPNLDSKHLTRNDPFFHYYVGGIRGLGTWGVGWYIERRPDQLERLVKESLEPDGDVQVLLEVTFSNHRIVAVHDVSNKPRDYFEEQLSEAVLDQVITRFGG